MATEVVQEVIPFSQTEIEKQVKSILLSKGLTDILYPGSNISQISDIMSYLIHVLNTNTAINLQEVILPLATKRVNVLFGARQLGYEATQKTSFKYNLNVSFKRNEDLNDSEIFNVLIPKYTVFESNGNKYYYMGQDIYIEGITNTTRFDKGFNIEIKEGDLIKYTDNDLLSFRTFSEVDENGQVITKQNYLIPFENIEEDGIETWLTYVDDYGTNVTKEEWKKYDQFLIDSTYSNSKRKFVRLQNLFLQMPSIFFEVGGYGNPLKYNTLIQSNILISKGKSGLAGDAFTVVGDLATQISVDVGTVTHYGTDAESMESIKENAPIFHNSANRAVTSSDYVSITQRHEAVKYSTVWGIEDEYLQDSSYASIFFSFLPDRTVREFASTLDGSTQNDVGENNAQHLQYDLQNLPYRPFIDGVIEPAVVGEPSVPDWMPAPINYLDKPDGWIDYSTTIGNPPAEVTNPGQKPLSKIQEARNNWLLEQDPVRVIMPENWIENPQIDGIGSTVGLELVQTQAQIDTHNNYKATVEATLYAIYEQNDKDWYASPGEEAVYIAWLAEQSVIDIITWQQDFFLYNEYVDALTEYNNTVLAYENYIDYLSTSEGIEYTDYRNSLDAAREIEDDNYNAYLSALEAWEENESDLDNIITNWILDDETEVYRQPLELEDTNVFTELEPFKIMTMKHNNRAPVYMDFYFEIKVIKYNLSKPISEINETIFNIINEYFRDYVERFEFEYLASNLQRRVDEVLGDSSGVEISLTNSIPLTANMYDEFSSSRDGNKIMFTLAMPYENLYTDGTNFDGAKYLPSIDTINFLKASDMLVGTNADVSVDIQYNDIVEEVGVGYYQAQYTELAVDLTLETFTDDVRYKEVGYSDVNNRGLYCKVDGNGDYLVPASTKFDKNIVLPIYLGIASDNGATDIVVGRYIIRNDRFQEIAVELFFENAGAIYPGDINNPPIPSKEFFLDYGYGYINIVYPTNIDSNSNNIPFKGYTVPRLRQVHFNLN